MSVCLCTQSKNGDRRCKRLEVADDGSLACGNTRALAGIVAGLADVDGDNEAVELVRRARAAGWTIKAPAKVPA